MKVWEHGEATFPYFYRATRYQTEKGIISLISPSFVSMGRWEIYCIEGDLFEDVERYDTKNEAENRIRELLE